MKDNYALLIATMNEIHKIIRTGDGCFLPEQSMPSRRWLL